jgi:hypothetical protein
MDKRLVKGFEKLINSDVIKNIYPMIDHIDIDSVDEHPLYVGYIMFIKIYLNSKIKCILIFSFKYFCFYNKKYYDILT